RRRLSTSEAVASVEEWCDHRGMNTTLVRAAAVLASLSIGCGSSEESGTPHAGDPTGASVGGGNGAGSGTNGGTNTSTGSGSGSGGEGTGATSGQGGSGTTGGAGTGGSMSGGGGYFPAGAWFYQDVSAAPTHPQSSATTQWLADNGGWGTGQMRIDFSIE